VKSFHERRNDVDYLFITKTLTFFLTIVFFLLLTQNRAQAIEYGGIGGTPAYPRSNNPRTQSIFIHTLKPGSTQLEGVRVINNRDEIKTLLVYVADSTPSSGGGFACKQYTEPKTEVGSWLTLEKEEVTLLPNTNELVNFVIKVPEKAEIGEHNGCILIQEKIENQQEHVGVNLSFRTGLRVAITIPGEIVRKLDILDFSVIEQENGNLLLRPKIKNSGNVSIDTNISIITKNIWGKEITHHSGKFPIFRGDVLELNFIFERPFWGGYYFSYLSLEYEANQDAEIGLDTGEDVIYLEGPRVKFFSKPRLYAIFLFSLLSFCLVLCVGFLIFYIKRVSWIKNGWKKYKVKKGEKIDVIAKRHNVSWKFFAKINKIKAPFTLRTGSIIRVPASKKQAKIYSLKGLLEQMTDKIKMLKSDKVIKKIKKKFFSISLVFMAINIVSYLIFPLIFHGNQVEADITDLVITSCDVNDIADSTCLSAISTDGGTSDALTKGAHIDAPFQTLANDAVNSATLYYDSWATLSGTWRIYVKDARDGTTVCSVDPAPEDASETTNSTSCGVTSAQLSSGVWLYVINNDGASPEVVNLDYVRLNVDYTPPIGVLTVDIVDSGGSPVASPSITMGTKAVSFSYQTSTGSFGTSSEKVRVDNPTANPQWTLSIAASAGSTAFWDGVSDYDFNDPTSQAGDGADADSLGGQMTIDPSVGTMTPEAGCSNTGLSLGSSSAFSEGVVDSITLIIAGATAETSCYWDLTGVSISQTIPAEQPADSYSLGITVTVIAN